MSCRPHTITDTGRPEGPIPPVKIWGPNMVVRTRAFRNGVRFDENVGPAAGQYVMGSEVNFLDTLAGDGLLAYWVPDAAVEHLIRPEQMTDTWLWGRAERAGKGSAYFRKRRGTHTRPRRIGKTPVWMLGELAGSALNAARFKLLRQRGPYLKARWRVHYLVGAIKEHNR